MLKKYFILSLGLAFCAFSTKADQNQSNWPLFSLAAFSCATGSYTAASLRSNSFSPKIFYGLGIGALSSGIICAHRTNYKKDSISLITTTGSAFCALGGGVGIATEAITNSSFASGVIGYALPLILFKSIKTS